MHAGAGSVLTALAAGRRPSRPLPAPVRRGGRRPPGRVRPQPRGGRAGTLVEDPTTCPDNHDRAASLRVSRGTTAAWRARSAATCAGTCGPRRTPTVITESTPAPAMRENVLRGLGMEVLSLVVGQGCAHRRHDRPRAPARTPRLRRRAMVLVFSGLMSVFSDLGLGAALVQRAELTEDDRSTVFWTSLGAGPPSRCRDLARPAAGSLLRAARGEAALHGALSRVRRHLAGDDPERAAHAGDELQRARDQKDGSASSARSSASRPRRRGTAPGRSSPSRPPSSSRRLRCCGPFALAAAAHVLPAKPRRPGRVRREGLRNANPFLPEPQHRQPAHRTLHRLGGARRLLVSYNVMLVPFDQIAGPIQDVLFPAFSRMQDDARRIGAAWMRVNRLVGASRSLRCWAWYRRARLRPRRPRRAWRVGPRCSRSSSGSGLLQSLQRLNSSILLACDRTAELLRYSVVVLGASLIAFTVGLRWGSSASRRATPSRARW